MALTLRTRHILPMLAERGLKAHRESLAELSDLLGLQTRPATGNAVQRSWRAEQVELVAVAFALRQRWLLNDDELRTLLVDDDGAHAAELVEQFKGVLAEFAQRLAAAREEVRRREAAGHPDVVANAAVANADAVAGGNSHTAHAGEATSTAA